MISEHKYGTAEFYAEQFSDFLADAQADDPKYGDNLVKGFLLAIDEWCDYHSAQVDEYNRLRERVRKALTV